MTPLRPRRSRPLRRALRALAVLGALALLAAPAVALDLDGAKAQGLVGERADGYLGAVAGSPAAEVAALVEDINARRRQHYQEIADKNGIPIDAVAAQAGSKLVARAGSGEWVADASGTWRKK